MEDNLQMLFSRTLKSSGYSLTKPRQEVFELLNGKEPQSMNELYKALAPSHDRASLYRTINLFERLGIVQRVNSGWKYKLELTDIFMHHHHHLTCLKCGRIIVFKEDQQLEELINKIAKDNIFVAQKHQMEIQGICDICHKNSYA